VCVSVFFFFAVDVEGVRIPGVEFSFSFNLIPRVGFTCSARCGEDPQKKVGGCGGRNFLLLDFESGNEAI
jgi:hypothetical protein